MQKSSSLKYMIPKRQLCAKLHTPVKLEALMGYLILEKSNFVDLHISGRVKKTPHPFPLLEQGVGPSSVLNVVKLPELVLPIPYSSVKRLFWHLYYVWNKRRDFYVTWSNPRDHGYILSISCSLLRLYNCFLYTVAGSAAKTSATLSPALPDLPSILALRRPYISAPINTATSH